MGRGGIPPPPYVTHAHATSLLPHLLLEHEAPMVKVEAQAVGLELRRVRQRPLAALVPGVHGECQWEDEEADMDREGDVGHEVVVPAQPHTEAAQKTPRDLPQPEHAPDGLQQHDDLCRERERERKRERERERERDGQKVRRSPYQGGGGGGFGTCEIWNGETWC